MAAQRTRAQYAVAQTEIYTGSLFVVFTYGYERIGRVVQVGPQTWFACHACREDGGTFSSADAGIEYVIGVDLKIDAEFNGDLSLERDRARLELALNA